jgi:hypothetical protein
MASYTGVISSKTATLVGSTVDTVTFRGPSGVHEVVNFSTTEDIWFTYSNGTPATPTAEGADCEVVRAGEALLIEDDAVAFKLISSGTPKYHIRVVS